MMATARIWLLCGVGLLFADSAIAQEDPGALGPHPVTSAEYTGSVVDLGCDSQGNNCSIPDSEFLAQVHYPTGLSNGPYPLVMMMHGRHSACFNLSSGEGQNAWPCPVGSQAVPSYKGYDYIASLLASHGLIVASISTNAINATDNMVGGGFIERAELLQRHLDQWAAFNSSGGAPFGTTFVGKVNLARVGTMGHSRGGRAVVDQFFLNEELGSPYGIKAVLPLAPVRNNNVALNNVPLGILVGYCDGDIEDMEGLRYFDDARYNVPTDNAPKYTILGMGANHDYFNRYWSPDQFAPGNCCSANPPPSCFADSCVSNDDWWEQDHDQNDPFCGVNAPNNGRMDAIEQRAFAKAYISAFFRRHLLDATQFDPLLQGDDSPPPSAQNAIVHQGYFPGALDRKDLNRLTSSANLSTNNVDGATSPTQSAPSSTGLEQYSLCGPGTPVFSCITATSREPHSTTVLLELAWPNATATYSNLLPIPNRDVSNFYALQFRVAVDYSNARNAAGQSQDFSVRVMDAAGRSSTVRASDYSTALFYPPGTGNKRASVLSTLRIPINAMLDVDVTNVSSIDFLFNQKATGAILVSDISFAGEGTTAAEKWLVTNYQSF